MISQMLLDKFFNAEAQDFETTRQIEIDHGVYGDFDDLKKTEYTVKSFDGYSLHCIYVPLEGSSRYVIISHGYTYSCMGSVKYLHMFRSLGFSCIIYDDRGCGKNKRAPITMGYNESRDLKAVIADLRNKFGKDIYIGLHGESLGSALSLMALETEKNIKFLVADCGYSDIFSLAVYQVRRSCHLPSFFVKRASKLCSKEYGFSLYDICPYKSIQHTKTPICFIHGEDDDFIPPEHCKKLYENAGGYREIHLFPNARHAESFFSDKEKYKEIVTEFLEKVNEKVPNLK